LDMKRFLPHIPQVQFPSEAFTAELYVDSGTRAVGLGQLAFGTEDEKSGHINYSPLEVVRLTIPRRVYTDNHMKVVAKSVSNVYKRRQSIRGLKIIWAPPALRHFTAHLEPV
jgi:tryptophanase